MTRPFSVAATLAIACMLASPSATALAGDVVPHDLRLDLAYGEPRGPASFIDELERELIARLDAAACFRSIERLADAPTTRGTPLVLRVRLDEFEEGIEYELSLAQRAQNRAPQETSSRQIAHAETLVRLDVQPLGEAFSIRSRRFAARRSWRPLFTEDPAEEARERLVQELARNVSEFVCKGSPAKWRRWIDRARARHADD